MNFDLMKMGLALQAASIGKRMSTTSESCPSCAGTGSSESHIDSLGHGCSGRCWRCNGTGLIEVTRIVREETQ